MDDASKPQRPPPSHPTLPTVYEKGLRGHSPPTPAADLQAGTVLGQYRIVRSLGAGGMGAVYEAVHTEIGKTVALKMLSRDLAEDPRAQARFLREALLASRLEHPHVVKITDFGSTAGVPFLVMELLRGEDLAAAINRNPRGLPFDEAVDVLLAVAAGVSAAHGAGVLHRDLKPRNIFLARNQLGDVEPKVLDFGISKQEGLTGGTALTDSGALLGTVPYLSPEHVKGGNPDTRSDQYALGVMLYECVTGRQPHEGHTPYAVMQNIAEGRFFPPSVLTPALPPALEREILRAMSNDPRARFASVHAFGQALLPFASRRQRVRWGEYFGSPEEAPTRDPATPTPEPPATRTTLLPELPLPPPPVVRPARPRTPVPRATPTHTQTVQRSPAPVPAITRDPAQRRPPASRTLPRLVALAAVLALAVWAVPQLLPDPAPAVAPARALPESAPAVVAVPAAPVPSVPQAPPPPPEVLAPPPPPQEVVIELASHPSGAAVWLQGEPAPRGVTPLALTLPSSSKAIGVSLRLVGHRGQTIAVVPDQRRVVEVALAAEPLVRPAPTRPVRKLRPRPRRIRTNIIDQTPDTAGASDEQAAEDRYEKLFD